MRAGGQLRTEVHSVRMQSVRGERVRIYQARYPLLVGNSAHTSCCRLPGGTDSCEQISSLHREKNVVPV